LITSVRRLNTLMVWLLVHGMGISTHDITRAVPR
jgi:hypothetical protein